MKQVRAFAEHGKDLEHTHLGTLSKGHSCKPNRDRVALVRSLAGRQFVVMQREMCQNVVKCLGHDKRAVVAVLFVIRFRSIDDSNSV